MIQCLHSFVLLSPLLVGPGWKPRRVIKEGGREIGWGGWSGRGGQGGWSGRIVGSWSGGWCWRLVGESGQ